MDFIEYSKIKEGADIPLNTGILNMPNKDYHSAAGISNSGLTDVARSPAHYFFKVKKGATPAMRMGTAIHTALLEPDKFKEDYLHLKEVKDRRSSGYKEAAKNHDPEFILTAPEGDKVAGMQEQIKNQPYASKLLTAEGYREVSIFTEDPETGVLVRIRADILTLKGQIIDVKKTQDSRMEAFGKSIFNYRYHVQAAFYSDVYEWASGKKSAAFGFLAVEEEIPHGCQLYALDDQSMSLGRDLYRQALNRYADCLEKAVWPCYDSKPQIISLPVWGVRQNESQIEKGENK